MTNADKYLKDGVDVEELATKIIEYGVFGDTATWKQAIIEFMNKQVKPTLTEDEKVILRNISKELKYIGRRGDEKHNFLYICEKPRQPQDYYALMFEDIFQFIKPRRRI